MDFVAVSPPWGGLREAEETFTVMVAAIICDHIVVAVFLFY